MVKNITKDSFFKKPDIKKVRNSKKFIIENSEYKNFYIFSLASISIIFFYTDFSNDE